MMTSSQFIALHWPAAKLLVTMGMALQEGERNGPAAMDTSTANLVYYFYEHVQQIVQHHIKILANVYKLSSNWNALWTADCQSIDSLPVH